MNLEEAFELFENDIYVNPVDCDEIVTLLKHLYQNPPEVSTDNCYLQLAHVSHLRALIDDLRPVMREFRNICLEDNKRKHKLYESIRRKLRELLEKIDDN